MFEQKTYSHNLEYIQENFTYNPDTGIITGPTRLIIDNNKYLQLHYVDPDNGMLKFAQAHHVALFLYTGQWPKLVRWDGVQMAVDHIDGNRQNNRFSNLRIITAYANNRNRQYKKHNPFIPSLKLPTSITTSGKKYIVQLGIIDGKKLIGSTQYLSFALAICLIRELNPKPKYLLSLYEQGQTIKNMLQLHPHNTMTISLDNLTIKDGMHNDVLYYYYEAEKQLMHDYGYSYGQLYDSDELIYSPR